MFKKIVAVAMFAIVIVGSVVSAEEKLNITLVHIRAGTVNMSSNEMYRDGVRLTPKRLKEMGIKRKSVRRKTEVSAFYMSPYETSYKVWKKVYDWGTANGYEFLNPGQMGSHKQGDHKHVPQEPVLNISWFDCVLWCNAASEMEGRIPCYYTDIEQKTIYRKGMINIKTSWVKWNVDGYRLPTESEWLYAWKANGKGYGWMDKDYVWDGENSEGTSHPVATKKPNEFGLYNMYGNAQEWLWDRYRDLHDPNDTKDSKGPETSDPIPSRRPDWIHPRRHCKGISYRVKKHGTDKRYGFSAELKLAGLGFRVTTSNNVNKKKEN